MADDNVVLDIAGLRMRYGARDVLHDAALRAHRGEVVALLGPNGAGKTTTIRPRRPSRSVGPGGMSRPLLY